MVAFLAVTGGVVLVAVVAAVYSSIHLVPEGQLRAGMVFGEMQAVLRPGVNFLPPFVSESHPIDPETMTIDRGHERIDVPEEYEPEVEDVAGVEPDETEDRFPA